MRIWAVAGAELNAASIAGRSNPANVIFMQASSTVMGWCRCRTLIMQATISGIRCCRFSRARGRWASGPAELPTQSLCRKSPRSTRPVLYLPGPGRLGGSRLGILLLMLPSRIRLALVMRRIGRRHGLEKQGQNAQIDESDGCHLVYLPVSACADLICRPSARDDRQQDLSISGFHARLEGARSFRLDPRQTGADPGCPIKPRDSSLQFDGAGPRLDLDVFSQRRS